MKKFSDIKRCIIASIASMAIFCIVFAIIGDSQTHPLIFVAIFSLLIFYYYLIKLIVISFKALRKKVLNNQNIASSHLNNSLNRYVSTNEVLQFEKTNDTITWGRILLLFFIFNPIALYLIFRKVNFETRNHYYNGVTMLILGVAVGIPNLIAVILLIPQFFSELILSSFVTYWVLISVALAIFGFIFKEKGKLTNKYINILFVQKITNINEIAKILKSTYSKVCTDIQSLIDNDTIRNIYIYHHDQEVIINGISNKIAIKCPKCAGTTVLNKNAEHICDYCGAKL